jgi:hypothetical protein
MTNARQGLRAILLAALLAGSSAAAWSYDWTATGKVQAIYSYDVPYSFYFVLDPPPPASAGCTSWYFDYRTTILYWSSINNPVSDLQMQVKASYQMLMMAYATQSNVWVGGYNRGSRGDYGTCTVADVGLVP